MPIGFIDRLKTTNRNAFGIVAATDVAGHRCVVNLDALYKLPDAILSLSKNNTDNDAIGQLWYVISEKKHYQLLDWSNRHKAEGWQVLNSGGDTTTLETRITALETNYANLLKKITELEELIGGMIQPIPITNIVLDSPQMLFTNPAPQTITATITPANATEKLTWEVNNSNVMITPSDDTLSCEVKPAIGASDGEYRLTVSSPSGLSKSVQIIFDGVEQEVVEPTVTLRGATSAKAGDEVTITASVQNGVGDGHYDWMVSGNATIKTQAEEQCIIVINNDAAEGDEVIVSYEINDTNGDGISFDHKITVEASEVQEPEVAISLKTVPAGITTAKVGDTITFESTIENPTPDNRGGWNVEGDDETYRYVTISDASETGAKITIREGAQPGGVFEVVHDREGRYTTSVKARYRITVISADSGLFTLDASVLDGVDVLL